MSVFARISLGLATTVVALAVPVSAGADVPSGKPLYNDGPTGRILLGGGWLFRADPSDVGKSQHFELSASSAGWRRITVPFAWNAND